MLFRSVGNPPHIETWINGVKFCDWQETERRHPDTGGIAVQVHGGGDLTKQFVRYRNIRVKKLTPTPDNVLTETERRDGWLLLFAVFGAILGGISLLIFPKVLLPTVGLRIANLILTPVLAGGMSAFVAKMGSLPGPQTHFWRGFCFALPFGLIRFMYADR